MNIILILLFIVIKIGSFYCLYNYFNNKSLSNYITNISYNSIYYYSKLQLGFIKGSNIVKDYVKSTPLLKVEATNPPKSVTTPPPRLITKLFLSAPNSVNTFQISIQVSMFLLISPASNSMISMVKSVSKYGKNLCKQYSLVLLSVKNYNN